MEEKERLCLRPKEVKEKIGVSSSTLNQWRYQSKGPPYIKVNGTILYPLDEFMKWKEESTVKPKVA